MPLIPFARQSRPGVEAIGYSGERLLNYFLRPSDGVSSAVLIGRSGLKPVLNLGGPVRAMLDNNGTLYALAASRLWKIVAGAAVDMGDVADDALATMAASGTQVAVVAGGNYYVCDGAATAVYPTGSVDTPKCVTYQDGYFVVAGVGGGRNDMFTISGLDDATTFNGLDFAFAESSPDGIIAALSDHGQIRLFGKTTIESWYNSGAAAFPFEPNRGELVPRGVLNGKTVAPEDNAIFWVGPDHVVYRSSGSSPEVISTREIEEVLSRSSVTAGYTFTDRGHKFYAIRREGQTTLCFDMTTRMWSERMTGGGWIVICAVVVGGVQYFGTETGAICKADSYTFTDDGREFYTEAVSVPVSKAGQRFTVAKVTLNMGTGDMALPDTPMFFDLYTSDGYRMETGDGALLSVSVPQEPAAQIMLQTSPDGRSWGMEKWRDLGIRGQYNRNIRWNGLGSFERFQIRIRITDPVKRDCYGVAYE